MPSTNRKTTPARSLSRAQEATQITWQLKGHLKNAQIAYLRVAVLLARMRDEKRYADLRFDDMEEYAADRLSLSRTSLYRYLQIHDWVKAFHPEWLEPSPKGFIPDLSDIADLIWIEKELATKRLAKDRRAALEELKKKALEGRLLAKDLRALRRRTSLKEKSLKSFLSALRSLLRRGAKLVQLPHEVITHLEAAIGILENQNTLQVAGMVVLDTWDNSANQPEIL